MSEKAETLDESGGYSPMILGSVYWLLASFVLIIFVTYQHRQRYAAQQVAA